MYFTDAGIEELDERRGDEQVTMAWLAERLRDFVDLNPEFETAIDRLAKWLARTGSASGYDLYAEPGDEEKDQTSHPERPVPSPLGSARSHGREGGGGPAANAIHLDL